MSGISDARMAGAVYSRAACFRHNGGGLVVREKAAAARHQLATTAIGKSGTPLGAMLTGDCLPPVSSLTRSSM